MGPRFLVDSPLSVKKDNPLRRVFIWLYADENTGLPHQQVSPVSEELRTGEDTRCAAAVLRTERIERVEWPAVNKQRGEVPFLA